LCAFVCDDDDDDDDDNGKDKRLVSTLNCRPLKVARPLDCGIGYNGWLFSPSPSHIDPSLNKDGALWWCGGESVFAPNTIERLAWFLITNQAKLLRDLLNVVNLRNINHENICCLNTAVVVTILASRRYQLISLLDELRHLGREEEESHIHRRGLGIDHGKGVDGSAHIHHHRHDNNNNNDSSGTDMNVNANVSIDGGRSYGPELRCGIVGELQEEMMMSGEVLMKNFRELVWFWSEYYTHRGRDRLSLEFSSHLRFDEWFGVVESLVLDDGSMTSLVSHPVGLPRSPYRRAARIIDGPKRSR